MLTLLVLNFFVSSIKPVLKELTVVLHAELLPVDCPLSGNFSASFQMFHLKQEKHVTFKHSTEDKNHSSNHSEMEVLTKI